MTLPEYISAQMEIPFAWGKHDCMLFTIGWVEIATGKKYLPEKLWKDEKEAVRLVKKQGGLIEVFDKHFTRIDPNYAKDGDLTVVDGVASLFSGSKVVSVGENGLAFKKRTEANNAWTY